MNKTEQKLLLSFLEDLRDDLGNAVCNDMTFKPTKENIELIRNAYNFHDFPEEELEHVLEVSDDGLIYTFDTFILEYLIHKLKETKI